MTSVVGIFLIVVVGIFITVVGTILIFSVIIVVSFLIVGSDVVSISISFPCPISWFNWVVL